MFETDQELFDAITLLIKECESRGDKMFLDIPDYWCDDPHWRCRNDHVSTSYLKSEAAGKSLCLACFGELALTYPEDRDGEELDFTHFLTRGHK